MNQDTTTSTSTEGPKKGGAIMSLIAVIILIIIAVVIAIAVGSAHPNRDVMNTYQNDGRPNQSDTTDASINSDLDRTGQDIDAASMNNVSF